jgi:hypothetical protein
MMCRGQTWILPRLKLVLIAEIPFTFPTFGAPFVERCSNHFHANIAVKPSNQKQISACTAGRRSSYDLIRNVFVIESPDTRIYRSEFTS